MFVALIQYPNIGQHKWISYATKTFVINVDIKEDAVEIIRRSLPNKDPDVQKALCEQEDYKDGEYYVVYLHAVPSSQKVVLIYKPNTGFNEPYEKIRM